VGNIPPDHHDVHVYNIPRTQYRSNTSNLRWGATYLQHKRPMAFYKWNVSLVKLLSLLSQQPFLTYGSVSILRCVYAARTACVQRSHWSPTPHWVTTSAVMHYIYCQQVLTMHSFAYIMSAARVLHDNAYPVVGLLV
jgi:hypothetical protein